MSSDEPAPEPDYWLTDEGIDDRLEMLAEQVAFRTFNSALVTEGKKQGYSKYVVRGPWDAKTCDSCAEVVGRSRFNVYTAYQFMPILPRHPNCRHYWDIVL